MTHSHKNYVLLLANNFFHKHKAHFWVNMNEQLNKMWLK